MTTLRDYQQSAIRAAYDVLRKGSGDPCITLPTGSGKSLILAEICSHAVKHGRRVIILAHVKELLEQNAAAIIAIAPHLAEHIGIYSAGLDRREADKAITVAGIQSIHGKDFGPWDLALIDEAHMIPPGDTGRYNGFIRDQRKINPAMRLIGLTATPYRMSSGYIYGPGRIFSEVAYTAEVSELIEAGWLSPITSKHAGECDVSSLRKRGGDYLKGETEALMNTEELVRETVADMLTRCEGRKSVLIFAAGVEHAKSIADEVSRHDMECGWVFGETPPEERKETLARFRNGDLRFLVNMNVLTTGFDAPGIDCIALVRPTASPGLYVQMVGRGLRKAPDKTDCLILDYGTNVTRHGPLDRVRVGEQRDRESEKAKTKVCPACQAVEIITAEVCDDCGFRWISEEKIVTHETEAADVDLVGSNKLYEMDVERVEYSRNPGRNGKPDTLKVAYVPRDVWRSTYMSVREFLCFDHERFSFPHRKAIAWWRDMGGDVWPVSVADAIARSGELMRPVKIRYRYEGKYPRIVEYVFEGDE